MGDAIVSYDVTVNPAPVGRTGTVTVQDTGGSPAAFHAVTQAAQPVVGASPSGVDAYSDGPWLIAVNADGAWDPSVDRSFNLGWPGATHFVGDWNGDGQDDVGVYNQGFWFLDFDGAGQFDSGVNDKLFPFGWVRATPVIGDWNGDGRDKAGVWINGFWFLDQDGKNVWDGGVVDSLFSWGASTAIPVVGDWNGNGSDTAGAFLDDEWVLDVDGDAQWDGGVTDMLFQWGTAGDSPVVGKWLSPCPGPSCALPSPVAHWNFESGAGNSLVDQTANGHSGTVSGATWTAGAIAGGNSALWFNGSNAFVEVPGSQQLLPGNHSYTVSVWVNTSTSNVSQAVVHNQWDWNHDAIMLQVDPPDGTATWPFHDVNNADNARVVDLQSLSDGQWHHIVGVRDRLNALVILYADGAESARINDTNAGIQIPTDNELNIGRHGTVNKQRYFNGLVDGIKICDTCLTAGEIQAFYWTEKP